MDMFVFVFFFVFAWKHCVAVADVAVADSRGGVGNGESSDTVFPFPFPFRYEYDPTRLVLPELPSLPSLPPPSSSFENSLNLENPEEEGLDTGTTPSDPLQSTTNSASTTTTQYLRNAHGLEVVLTGNTEIDGIYLAFENSIDASSGGGGDGGSLRYSSSSSSSSSGNAADSSSRTEHQQQQQQHCLIRWPLDGLGQGQFVDLEFGNQNNNSRSSNSLLCGGEPHGLTFSVEHTEQGRKIGGKGAIDAVGGGDDGGGGYAHNLSNLRSRRISSRREEEEEEEEELHYEKDTSSYYLYHVNNDQVVSKTDVVTGQIVWQNTAVPNITSPSQLSTSSGTVSTAAGTGSSDAVDLQLKEENDEYSDVVPSPQSSSQQQKQKQKQHQEVGRRRSLSTSKSQSQYDDAVVREEEEVSASDYPYRPTWVAVPPDGPYVYLCDGYGSNFVYLMWKHNGTFVVGTNSNTSNNHAQIVHWGGHVSNTGSIRTRDDLDHRTRTSDPTTHGLFATNHGCLYDTATQQIVVADRENGRLEYFDYFKYQNDNNNKELDYHDENSATPARTKKKIYGRFEYSHTTDLRKGQEPTPRSTDRSRRQHQQFYEVEKQEQHIPNNGRNGDDPITPVSTVLQTNFVFSGPSLGNTSRPCIVRRQVVDYSNLLLHDDGHQLSHRRQQPQVVYGVVPDLTGSVAVVARRHIIPTGGGRNSNTNTNSNSGRRQANEDDGGEERNRRRDDQEQDGEGDEDQVVYVIDVAGQLLGPRGRHLHPHDAQMLPNGDIVVATWNPGRLSYWKRVPI